MKFSVDIFQMPKKEFGFKRENIKVIRIKLNMFINDLNKMFKLQLFKAL